MNECVKRLYVEKKKEYAVEADSLLEDLRQNLGIAGLTAVRLINRYDIAGLTEQEYEIAKTTIFSEPPVDDCYDEHIGIDEAARIMAVEYLPGQYDQRADSAAQCAQLLTQKQRPIVKTAKLFLLYGELSETELEKIKHYCINRLEAREASLQKPERLEEDYAAPEAVAVLENFINIDEEELKGYMEAYSLAMSFEDLKFVQEYFIHENRNPTITELKVLDTYWSDHCRHTTFLTGIKDVRIEPGQYSEPIKKSFKMYQEARSCVYENKDKDISLMDIAVIAMKELRQKGMLEDLDESEEINACSIVVDAKVNGGLQKWVVMFKNETHNHPTEIEPFGGASTCLGGAIRDPLSGRAYVFGAMRVTGSGDPRASIESTLPGKLPQRKITTGAAAGYSAYGNQIGLATGQVAEIYHEGYVAKRMEIGAVLGAAPKNNIIRQTPEKGDVVILLGGRTGRDGCGGATGSSKEHDESSLLLCGSEVQKGNPPTERKLQRLFRKPDVSRMIKRCNDFGAGGVSVAIGELAPGLEIFLDAVPKKYEGLDGTELAISESQERMAVVVAPQNAVEFIRQARLENLEATVVATVTDDNRLKMNWKNQKIVDIDRSFLDTNGVKQHAWVKVQAPEQQSPLEDIPELVKRSYSDLKQAWLANLQELNVCSQQGLVERFDSTIGAGTLLMPYGGKYQDTPSEGMAMKLPVVDGETDTSVIMTYGYNPQISIWSPFHGAYYAVLEAVTKAAAIGADYSKIRLTLQEYFEKLGKDPVKWGKPFSALLGAYYAQRQLGIAAIGGKDSMSGTFRELNVPPTLVAFAVAAEDAELVVSQEFKKTGSAVILLQPSKQSDGLLDIDKFKKQLEKVKELIGKKLVRSSNIIKLGGLAAAVSKMCFGNRIGFKFEAYMSQKDLFIPDYGAVLLELAPELKLEAELQGVYYTLLGHTWDKQSIFINGYEISLTEALKAWKTPLNKVFPVLQDAAVQELSAANPKANEVNIEVKHYKGSGIQLAKPRIFIPVFPGTNCEYDTAKAFIKAGGEVKELVLRNLTPSDIEESITEMAKLIAKSQIIALPGGFSGGDEPDGSGKFIATVFRNPRIKAAVEEFLKQRDGLMIGICNGFQALVKLGLLPFGQITDLQPNSPTLTYNNVGHHMSSMVWTRIASVASPWLSKVQLGDIHTIAISHGEGRFVADQELLQRLILNNQIATQYVDDKGQPTMKLPYNPNGSVYAVEGLLSPDGRIIGKMGHSERISKDTYKNIPGSKEQRLFEAGVEYFR